MRDRLRRQVRQLRRPHPGRWPTRSPPRASAAAGDHKDAVDDLKITLKENIEVGRVVQVDAVGDGEAVDTYLHRQDGRGVNGVVVVLRGGSEELAHDIAVHIAFAKPQYLARDDVPADVVEDERETLLGITKAEGKPEAAWPKIVEGRLNGWYKERVLARAALRPRREADHRPARRAAGEAEVVRFAQFFIGG